MGRQPVHKAARIDRNQRLVAGLVGTGQRLVEAAVGPQRTQCQSQAPLMRLKVREAKTASPRGLAPKLDLIATPEVASNLLRA